MVFDFKKFWIINPYNLPITLQVSCVMLAVKGIYNSHWLNAGKAGMKQEYSRHKIKQIDHATSDKLYIQPLVNFFRTKQWIPKESIFPKLRLENATFPAQARAAGFVDTLYNWAKAGRRTDKGCETLNLKSARGMTILIEHKYVLIRTG